MIQSDHLSSNQRPPDDPRETAYARVAGLVRNRDINAAAVIAREIVARYPDFGKGWKALGVVSHQQGRFDDALNALRQAQQLLPRDPELLNNLSITLQALGRYEEAEASVREASRLQPNYAGAFLQLGNLQAGGNRPDDAVSSFRAALRLAPADARAHCGLALALSASGRDGEAEESFRRALSLQPAYGLAHYGYGNVLFRSFRHDAAVVEYRRALASAPRWADIHHRLALIQDWRVDFAAAVASYRRGLELAPDDVDMRANFGWTLQRAGELGLALEQYRKAIGLALESALTGSPAALTPFEAMPGKIDPGRAEEQLWQVLAQLAAAGVHAFATAGTLLALTRDGALFPHDKDIDLHLPVEDFPQATRCLSENGWVGAAKGDTALLNTLPYQHRESGLTLDLVGLRTESESGLLLSGPWREGVPADWERLTEYPGPLALHQRETRYGMVWELDDPDAWLTTMYGDWRTPKPYFDTVISAQNLRSFSLLTKCFAHSRLLMRWRKGQHAHALDLTRQTLRHIPDDSLLLRAEERLADLADDRV